MFKKTIILLSLLLPLPALAIGSRELRGDNCTVIMQGQHIACDRLVKVRNQSGVVAFIAKTEEGLVYFLGRDRPTKSFRNMNVFVIEEVISNRFDGKVVSSQVSGYCTFDFPGTALSCLAEDENRTTITLLLRR